MAVRLHPPILARDGPVGQGDQPSPTQC